VHRSSSARSTGGGTSLAKQLAGRDAAIADLADQVERTFTKVRTIVADNQRYQRQVADLTKRLAEVRKPRLIVDNVISRADKALSGIETAVARPEQPTLRPSLSGWRDRPCTPSPVTTTRWNARWRSLINLNP
jgi:ABC-type transporter Mla subunit MlaD